ncbi:hypothetical protein LUZ62_077123 [Rhynchospora pubera]|uniref:Cytochrome P450 n=1 Tax=Rhynchospora pubera TaxID=906938 RepID=A0AAV8DKL1_9POAL|nr:hypothetical protein LUZ62_077123 [Rhynchospora pubera]
MPTSATNQMEMEIAQVQNSLSHLFFTFSISFLFFSIIVLFLRSRPWCNCHICKTYLSFSWRSEFSNFSDWYTHLLKKSATGTVHIHVLGTTITANPANVQHMLKTRFENYPKGKQFSSILGDFLGHGIFNSDGDMWRFQRKMASLELGSVSVRSYAFKIVSTEINDRLIPFLRSISGRSNSGTVDIQDLFRRFALDTICKISFGLDPGCLDLDLPMSDFANAFDTASRLSALRATTTAPIVWKLKRFLNVGSEKELKHAIKIIDGLAQAVIRERRKIGFSTGHDLLSRFMGAVQEQVDDKFLRDIVVSFLLAGRDTVASGLTTFFLLLSQNPAVAAAIREEIETNKKDGVLCPGQLNNMHYVHAALYENLRLYPPVQFDSKFSAEDDVLPDGTFIRKGTRVMYHPYAMGRMESIWGEDCMEFKPERWLRDGVFTPESLFKYTVFQAGPRVCIGKELSIMEMKTVIVAIMLRFNIEVLMSKEKPQFALGLTASIKGGVQARILHQS